MDTDVLKRYGAKARSGLNEADAQKIGEELELLAADKPFGGVTPEEFVEAAQSGKAPNCASRLTWDDDVAGYQWRLHEARNTLNAITITEADEEGEDDEIRAFHLVSVEVEDGEPHKERRYVPLSIIREESELVEQVIAQAKRELQRAKEKLALYEEHVREHHPKLARVMDAVDEHLEEDHGEQRGI